VLPVWLPATCAYGAGRICCISAMSRSFGCAGLWWGSSLLISSQAIRFARGGRILVHDVGWHLLTGRFRLADGLHVGHALPALVRATLQLSHRGFTAMLDDAKGGIRPAPRRVAGAIARRFS